MENTEIATAMNPADKVPLKDNIATIPSPNSKETEEIESKIKAQKAIIEAQTATKNAQNVVALQDLGNKFNGQALLVNILLAN